MAKEDDYNWSDYWNWEDSHTKGPQKCACGGPSTCENKSKHILAWLKEKSNETKAL